MPTAVYASDTDFSDGALTEAGVRTRAAEAGGQLAALLVHRSAASAPVKLAAAE
jgi:FMN reductase